MYRQIKRACSGAVGLPVAVQIVGKRFGEEAVLRVMRQLEQLSGFKQLKETTHYSSVQLQDEDGSLQQQQRLVVTTL